MGGNWPRSASCVHSTTTVPQPPHDTALGLARQRFVDSLGQKAGELRGALALLVGSPDAARPRDDFRARLQALYASAQVFRMNVLAAALQEGAAVLDLARTEGREVSQAELDERFGLLRRGARVLDLLDFCMSHLRHENQFVHTAIEARAPGFAAVLQQYMAVARLSFARRTALEYMILASKGAPTGLSCRGWSASTTSPVLLQRRCDR